MNILIVINKVIDIMCRKSRPSKHVLEIMKSNNGLKRMLSKYHLSYLFTYILMNRKKNKAK